MTCSLSREPIYRATDGIIQIPTRTGRHIDVYAPVHVDLTSVERQEDEQPQRPAHDLHLQWVSLVFIALINTISTQLT